MTRERRREIKLRFPFPKVHPPHEIHKPKTQAKLAKEMVEDAKMNSMLIAATLIAFTTSALAQAQYVPSACAVGYYRNAEGVCVHKPTPVPQEGATALCRDVYIATRHAFRIFVRTTVALSSYCLALPSVKSRRPLYLATVLQMVAF